MSLENELKKAMGYTDEIRRCENCQFLKRKENPMLDRDWLALCDFNNIAQLGVSLEAHCDKWKPKTTPSF